jgi:hypothetical protein
VVQRRIALAADLSALVAVEEKHDEHDKKHDAEHDGGGNPGTAAFRARHAATTGAWDVSNNRGVLREQEKRLQKTHARLHSPAHQPQLQEPSQYFAGYQRMQTQHTYPGTSGSGRRKSDTSWPTPLVSINWNYERESLTTETNESLRKETYCANNDSAELEEIHVAKTIVEENGDAIRGNGRQTLQSLHVSMVQIELKKICTTITKEHAFAPAGW